MTTAGLARPLAQPAAEPVVPASGWGNSAPLGLAGFAVTTFMLSMVNAKLVVGLVVAFLAAYLSRAELCEASYRRSVLPLWPLAKH